MSNALTILIPMSGLGSRFTAAGYIHPKPLIPVLARPMLIHLIANLNLIPSDSLYLGLQRAAEHKFHIISLLHAHLPSLQFHAILLDHPTLGPAHTLHLMLQHIPSFHLHRKVVSLDCDTLYYHDILHPFRLLPPAAGGVACFEHHSSLPIYSYVRMHSDTRLITDIREKHIISEYANTGAYGFGNGCKLQEYLEQVLAGPLPSCGEFYTSFVIDTMLRDGVVFYGFEAGEFRCVGTPVQLKAVVEEMKLKKRAGGRGTLVFQTGGGKEALEIMSGLRNFGFEVLIKRDGDEWKEDFQVASEEVIEKARKLGWVFDVGADLRKRVGW